MRFLGSARKVAIVGGGPTRKKAPYDDRSWDIWAFSSRRWSYPRVTRWFELHAMTDLKQQLSSKKRGRRTFRNYMRYMRRLNCPVYMQKAHARIPTSVRFPVEEVLTRFGPIFTSTASYLVAFAIMEGYEVIGLWGIDPKGKEYARQRKAISYLLGIARREGIKLEFPSDFSVQIPRKPSRETTSVLYAYDWRSPDAWWRRRVRKRSKKRRRTKGRKGSRRNVVSLKRVRKTRFRKKRTPSGRARPKWRPAARQRSVIRA